MLRSKTIPLILGICMVYKTFANSTQTTQEQITASGSSRRFNTTQRIGLGTGLGMGFLGILVTIIIAYCTYRCNKRGRNHGNSMDNESHSASRAGHQTGSANEMTLLTIDDSAGSAQHGPRGDAGVSVPEDSQDATDSSHHQAVQATDSPDVTSEMTPLNDSAGRAQHGARGDAGVSVPEDSQDATDSSHHQGSSKRLKTASTANSLSSASTVTNTQARSIQVQEPNSTVTNTPARSQVQEPNSTVTNTTARSQVQEPNSQQLPNTFVQHNPRAAQQQPQHEVVIPQQQQGQVPGFQPPKYSLHNCIVNINEK